MKIGLFDSGLGGLTILKAVTTALPEYSYEFYGDTKNLPYGDKTENQIYELTKVAVEYLFERDCALVIIACNTSSAETLRRLQDEYLPNSKFSDRRILGVIIPVIEEVIESGCKRTLLLATKRTVSSGKYHLELGKRNELNVKIEAVATPELVPLIEAGNIDEAVEFVNALLEPRVGEVDGVILGCTHYTLLKDKLREIHQDKITIFSQDEIVPEKISDYLDNHPEIKEKLDTDAKRNIHLTEHRGDYDELLKSFLQGSFIED